MMSTLKRVIKECAYSVAPHIARTWDEGHWLDKKTRELLERSRSCETPSQYVAALRATGAILPLQKWQELTRLLEAVARLQPSRLCEIGSAEGGTLFLFSQLCDPNALILSLDIAYTPARRRCFPRFGTRNRQLFCIEADSHSVATRDKVLEYLDGNELDFLFIDGDHSYSGVAADFELYSPLVRTGGIIAFHDIVPDMKTRTGVPSNSDSGEVPAFWRELRNKHFDCEELIDDAQQDGYGIGVVHWNGISDRKQ